MQYFLTTFFRILQVSGYSDVSLAKKYREDKRVKDLFGKQDCLGRLVAKQ